MISELGALHSARSERSSMAGFALVMDSTLANSHPGSPPPASKLLDRFPHVYGVGRAGGMTSGLDWVGAPPGPTEPISTWSQHEDDSWICVIEGDFYADVFGKRPTNGSDAKLASGVAAEFSRRGAACLDELNGLFSGFAFSKRERRLWMFVDQTGSRMLYFRTNGPRLEAASNIYGLGTDEWPLELDPLSLNEDMVFGAPLRHRTIFRGVSLVAPGTAMEFDGRRVIEHRYFRYPARGSRMSTAEMAERIDQAMERSVRYLGLGDAPTSIGMSGGKDSRLVCSAVVHEGLRPKAFTFSSGPDDGDAAIGSRIAEIAGLSAERIDLSAADNTEEAVGVSVDAAILSDGFTVGTPYLMLGACASRHSRILFTGYAGDCLSGSWSGVEPWRARTIEDLSRINLELLGYVVSPALVAACLPRELRVSEADLLADWLDFYRAEHAALGDLLTTHMSVRIGQRNRRGAASFYHSMRPLSTPVQVFAARDVMETYLALPISALKGQKAHVAAAAYRYPAFGMPSWKTLGRIPLSWEPYTRIPLRLRYARRVRRNRRPRPLPAGEPKPQSGYLRTRRFGEALTRSSMIDQTYLRKELLPRVEPDFAAALHKIAATAMHAEYGLNRTFLLPPFFLESWRP